MAPASEQTLMEALAVMSVKVARRDGGEINDDVALAAYVDALLMWPADVALQALREWPSLSKWWPTWFELEERLKVHAGPRLRLRQELRALPAKAEEKFEHDPTVAAGLAKLAKSLGGAFTKHAAPSASALARSFAAPERTDG